jgi:hypothetical protein
MLDDLLGTLPTSQNPAHKAVALPPPTPQSQAIAPPLTAQPANAVAQAAGGQGQPGGQGGSGQGQPAAAAGGPKAVALPSVVPRGTVAKADASAPTTFDLSDQGTFEKNLAVLLNKDLQLAQHNRAMAISLFQVHLDRAEVLDSMQLSMPVATVIADNTGATLKSLELAMKASEQVHKVAELLVNAQKNGDAAALAALKIQQAKKGDGDAWGDDGELPK